MKVNTIFTYLSYICILVYIFTMSIEVFRCAIISFIIAMTYDNIKQVRKIKTRRMPTSSRRIKR